MNNAKLRNRDLIAMHQRPGSGRHGAAGGRGAGVSARPPGALAAIRRAPDAAHE